ncbi:MAG: hypothetical protein JNM60_08650, partial [Candidatus Competibacteraceae bacterium]|nr:hypothetical protein [Candidatus Competibacteraceae bacterium]
IVAGPSALFGCAPPPKIEYRPLPDALIPPAPAVPTVPADDLKCLSKATYLRLANRDQLLRRHIAELRALLGADDAHPDR